MSYKNIETVKDVADLITKFTKEFFVLTLDLAINDKVNNIDKMIGIIDGFSTDVIDRFKEKDNNYKFNAEELEEVKNNFNLFIAMYNDQANSMDFPLLKDDLTFEKSNKNDHSKDSNHSSYDNNKPVYSIELLDNDNTKLSFVQYVVDEVLKVSFNDRLANEISLKGKVVVASYDDKDKAIENYQKLVDLIKLNNDELKVNLKEVKTELLLSNSIEVKNTNDANTDVSKKTRKPRKTL